DCRGVWQAVVDMPMAQYLGMHVEQNDVQMPPADLDPNGEAPIGVEQDRRCRVPPASAKHRATMDKAILREIDQNGRYSLRGQAGEARNFRVGSAGIETDNGQNRPFVAPPDTLMTQSTPPRLENIARWFIDFAHAHMPSAGRARNRWRWRNERSG